MEYKMEDVAEWAAQKRGIEMPVPPTPAELLTQKLRSAASTDRRHDPAENVDYRGNLSVGKMVDGEYTTFWFDADGPAATHANVTRNFRSRIDQMINDGVRVTSDNAHWRRTHPNERPVDLNLDLTDEVQWRMNAPGQDDEKNEKAS